VSFKRGHVASFAWLAAGIEPDALRDEKRFVLQSTQKLAFNNYKTFIETAECTREVFKEVS